MAGDEGIAKSSEAESYPRGTSVPEAASRSVFLSYASHDAATASSICQFLESHGVSCWLAPRDVKPGTEYADAIVAAINEAKAIVLVLSGSAVASSHVGREIERAASKHKQIVAFRIDAAPLSRALEYFLSNSQWIDAQALGMPAALAKLAEAVGSAATNPAVPVVQAKPVGRAGGRKNLIAAAAVVVGVGVAVALGLHFWTSKPMSAQAPAVAASGTRESAASPISDKSIAVLPFVDMSEKKDQEYFADGMAEEILDLLAKVPGLKVIGRTSSFQFKSKTDDLRAIGRALSASHVLEGSVRRTGDRVRVTAQLIDAHTGAHIWSESYDRDLRDVLDVQRQIAANLTVHLKIELGSEDVLRFGRPLQSIEAYDSYLKGLHAHARWDHAGFQEAADDFQHALDLDPSFAPAAEGLAYAWSNLALFGYVPPKTGYENARTAAVLAIRLNPRSGAGHMVLCRVHTEYDWDWQSAERERAIALSLDPNSAFTKLTAVWLPLVLGQLSEAERRAIAAIAADPLSAVAHNLAGNVYLNMHRYADADASFRRALELAPTYETGHWYLGIALLEKGDLQGSLAAFDHESDPVAREQGLALVYYALHRIRESNEMIERLERDADPNWPVGLAQVNAFIGQPDRALEWLERAYAVKDPNLFGIMGDPLLASLEADPRFKAFLRKMNRPE